MPLFMTIVIGIFIINSELVNAIKTKEDMNRALSWLNISLISTGNKFSRTCDLPRNAIHESSDISKLDQEIVLGNIEGRS
jgi:hypothetical protein